MFGSGPDQLSGYCQQVLTMFSSSADWGRCGAFFEGRDANPISHPRSQLPRSTSIPITMLVCVCRKPELDLAQRVSSQWLAVQQSNLASTGIDRRGVFEVLWQLPGRLLWGSVEPAIARLVVPLADALCCQMSHQWFLLDLLNIVNINLNGILKHQ